jgi:LmbE family N-acetylglucosaminyl deacetylase
MPGDSRLSANSVQPTASVGRRGKNQSPGRQAKMTTFDVLVVSAHPDDAEFGAAGTVALWAREGLAVAYIVCTDGEKGTSDRRLPSRQLAEIRKTEQQEAARTLGVQKVDFLGYPDQGLEDSPEFRKHIVRVLRSYRPKVVVTSDPYRRYVWHRDHRIVGQVVLDAVFPFARDHLAYADLIAEGLEPHKVRELWFWGAEDINHRTDISPVFDRKLAALQCHRSQVRELKIRDLENWLRERCRAMADATEYELAEGFHRVRLPS